MEHPEFYVPYSPPKKSRFSELVQTGRFGADLILNSLFIQGDLYLCLNANLFGRELQYIFLESP